MRFDTIGPIARNQWAMIHQALGVRLEHDSHRRHQPCPGCGGEDCFRITDLYAETGGFFCSQRGAGTTGGDGFSLLSHVFGWTPLEALKAVASVLGMADGELDQADLDRRIEVARRQSEKARQIAAVEEEKNHQAAMWRVKHYIKVGTRPTSHGYLTLKRLDNPHNLLAYKEFLVAIMRDGRGNITGAQKISPDGTKQHVKGSHKQGSWHWLDSAPMRGEEIAVCEGWATGASSGHGCVAVTFDAGNMVIVAQELLILYPLSRILVLADNDQAGIRAANVIKAADPQRVTVKYAPNNHNDFNDFHADRVKVGIEKLEEVLERAAIIEYDGGFSRGEAEKKAENGRFGVLSDGRVIVEFETTTQCYEWIARTKYGISLDEMLDNNQFPVGFYVEEISNGK